jgi:hypothetical protein
MSKRKLDELIDNQEPAIKLLQQLVNDAKVPCELLPPGPEREKALLYDTGGLLIDDGWLRLLGSGHAKLSRSLHEWNSPRTDGAFYLVGDDLAGGFFAINGGAFGDDVGSVYYWPPDSLEWESLERGFTDFVAMFLTHTIENYYTDLRWSTWREDARSASSDQCFAFFPFLWTKEGSVERSHRSVVPMSQMWDAKVDIVRQLG